MAFYSFIETFKRIIWAKQNNWASNTQYDAVEAKCQPRQAAHSWGQILPILGLNLGFFLSYSGIFCYAAHRMLLNRHELGLIYCKQTGNSPSCRSVGWRLHITPESDSVSAPARSAVSYESRHLDQSTPSPFNQAPSLEVDTAWHQLLKYNNILLQAEDLAQINKTSVLLRDKSAYLGGLDVFHELHCLNYIRENVYADYYALEPGHFRTEHLYHCIDHLREILMCHGDIAVRTYEWGESTRYPLMKQKTLHECRKWEPIVAWAGQHDPAALPMPILENPQLGIIEPQILNKTQA